MVMLKFYTIFNWKGPQPFLSSFKIKMIFLLVLKSQTAEIQNNEKTKIDANKEYIRASKNLNLIPMKLLLVNCLSNNKINKKQTKFNLKSKLNLNKNLI
jgi:hypothetical protein